MVPNFTGEAIGEAVKGLGQKATEERKAAMRKMMKQAQAATSKLKGDSTEVHSKITTSPLEEKDFEEFAVAKDAVRKESLFGGVLDELPHIPPSSTDSPSKVEAKKE